MGPLIRISWIDSCFINNLIKRPIISKTDPPLTLTNTNTWLSHNYTDKIVCQGRLFGSSSPGSASVAVIWWVLAVTMDLKKTYGESSLFVCGCTLHSKQQVPPPEKNVHNSMREILSLDSTHKSCETGKVAFFASHFISLVGGLGNLSQQKCKAKDGTKEQNVRRMLLTFGVVVRD